MDLIGRTKTGGDIDVGEIHFLIGPFDAWFYVGRRRLFRAMGGTTFSSRWSLARRPDDHLRARRTCSRKDDRLREGRVDESLRANFGLASSGGGTGRLDAGLLPADASARGHGDEKQEKEGQSCDRTKRASARWANCRSNFADRIMLHDHSGGGRLVGKAEEQRAGNCQGHGTGRTTANEVGLRAPVRPARVRE